MTNPKGNVKSKEDNQPLPFALVGLHKNGQRKYFTTTDIQGRYFLRADKGHYELKVHGRTLDGENVSKEAEVDISDGVVGLEIRV